ncbi:MAG: flagellar basal body-associated FliL family protein [Gammaproteobacteria bacterium]|nr:flagellar basal body-associated FliL family protein [Gammaproteobacteria bacterium]
MKKKLVLFSIIGVLILGGGGASAYFFVLKGDATEDLALAADGETPIETPQEKLPPAMYYNLPTLVVSANYQGRLRYLQVKLSVMTRDEDTLELLQDNTPLLQDSLILLLGSYEFTELETLEGKETLRKQAQTKIRELIQDDGVESVLFTGFVIQ